MGLEPMTSFKKMFVFTIMQFEFKEKHGNSLKTRIVFQSMASNKSFYFLLSKL
jgi:hypothetical protein